MVKRVLDFGGKKRGGGENLLGFRLKIKCKTSAKKMMNRG